MNEMQYDRPPSFVGPDARITYKNHRGEVAERLIHITKIRHGTSRWHDGDQWFLEAFDLGKADNRSFAMRDILKWEWL